MAAHGSASQRRQRPASAGPGVQQRSRHALTPQRRERLERLHEEAIGGRRSAKRNQGGVDRPQSASAGTGSLSKLKVGHLRTTKGLMSPLIYKKPGQRRRESGASKPAEKQKGLAGARPPSEPRHLSVTSARRMDAEDSSTWWDMPHHTSARGDGAPMPQYVIRNRQLAQIDAERPKDRQVRRRSDISQFYLDSTGGVDRYDAATMQAGIAAGAFRRRRSDIGVMSMELEFGHTRPMQQSPGNTGTFRLGVTDVNRAAHMPDMAAAWGD